MLKFEKFIINIYFYYMRNKKGCVYLIEDSCNEVYKIGVTRKSAKARLKQLQTGNPNELKLLEYFECEYPFRLENLLHNKYKLQQAFNEWYYMTKEDINNFIEDCKFYDNMIEVMKDNPYFGKNLH